MNTPKILQTDPPPDVIDLGMGNPDFALLPLKPLQQAAELFFAAGDTRSLQYGLEQGDGRFRQALAEFLTRAYGSAPVDPNLLFVTAGASSALDLICTLYTQPGDVILVEEPSYFLALRIFADHGLRTISTETDEQGLCLDTLEEKITAYKPKLIYTIPTYHNPSGRTIPQERREGLIALAQRHNVLIVADEVYHFLAYTRKPPRPFAAAAAEVEQVISVNSFSKILAPGLRLGWIQAHESVVKTLAGSGMLDSGGGLNPFTSAVVRGMIETGGLEENIHHLKTEYASRLYAMGAALRRYLPDAEWAAPGGGFFYWVRLPGINAAALRGTAAAYKVDIRQGDLFSSQNGLQNYCRLCFSFYGSEDITEGVRRLGECVQDYVKRRS